MEYMNNRYIYIEKENLLVPISFDISKLSCEDIHNLYGLGISDEEYYYLSKKFGKNEIKLKNKSFFHIFFEQFFHPLYLYQVISCIIWFYTNYLYFAILIIIVNFIFLIVSTIQLSENYRNIEYSSNAKNSKITRNFKQEENIQSIDIVPGDIIKIKSEEIMPCDAILLEGNCVVDESYFTGEPNPLIKNPLRKNSSLFTYSSNKKSILFQGTRLTNCESKGDKNTILALALNTGFNTNRGNLIQNMLFLKESNYSFSKDIMIFFYGSIIVYLGTILIIILIYFGKISLENHVDDRQLGPSSGKLKDLINAILLIGTTIFPASLPVSLTFTWYYFYYLLKKKNIKCLSEKNIITAGNVNFIVLDKTGTLTEKSLDLYGFMTTKIEIKDDDNKFIRFDKIEKSSHIYNSVHKEFWKKYCIDPKDFNLKDYKNDFNNNIIYFVECLATCHSLDQYQGKIIGNNIDEMINKNLNWILEKSLESVDSDNNFKYEMLPKNNYKITEELIFNNTIKSINDKKYKLTIMKSFDFSSKYQSNSVVVHNNLDSSYRFFIKGSPEKIIPLCIQESLPQDIDGILLNKNYEGFRIFACATKPLRDNISEHGIYREKYEKDLIFLGLILFKNKLKKDTKHIIGKLKDSECEIVIATGDNPFNTISVAQECEIINKEQNIFFIKLEKTYKKVDKLSWYNLTKKIADQNKITTNFDKLINSTGTSNYNIDCLLKEINEEKNSIICITGEAFNYIVKRRKNTNINEDEKTIFQKIANSISQKGKIFSRMESKDKVTLVKFLKENKSNIVAMCSDGAHDCGTLLAADIGISISNLKDSNITSHFYSYQDSISCIETILKNGRACFENCLIIFKFIIIYAACQNLSTILFYIIKTDGFDDKLFYIIDIVIVLVPSLLASKTEPNYKLKKNPVNNWLGKNKLLLSVVGQYIISLGFQIGFFYFLICIEKPLFNLKDVEEFEKFQNIFFIFSAFQYLGVLFTYNMNCRHRKNYDTNKLYMLYISICMFLCIISISSKSIDLFEVIKNFLNSTIIFSKEDINYIKREFLALVVILTNFSFTFIYGSFLERITD